MPQAATKVQVDNVITFNENGDGVSITRLPAANLTANTANARCPADDAFTGALCLQALQFCVPQNANMTTPGMSQLQPALLHQFSS